MDSLIFRLYINDLNKSLTESCKVVQYADDTLLFCVDMISKLLYSYCKTALQLSNFVWVLHKTVSKTQHKETRFDNFHQKQPGRNHNSKFSIILNDKKIEEKADGKYLRVILDQIPTLQREVTNILRKMARGIKTLQSTKKKSLKIKCDYFFSHEPSALCFSHEPSALPSKIITQFDIQTNKIA